MAIAHVCILLSRFRIIAQPMLEEMTLDDAHFGIFKGHIFDSSIAQGIARGKVPPLASASSSGSKSSNTSVLTPCQKLVSHPAASDLRT